ncbi:MAG: hypothetical protein GEU97_00905 [Actinophytocola sp.]|nr:hypothetical protein [Actinophytocola sp.]
MTRRNRPVEPGGHLPGRTVRGRGAPYRRLAKPAAPAWSSARPAWPSARPPLDSAVRDGAVRDPADGGRTANAEVA